MLQRTAGEICVEHCKCKSMKHEKSEWDKRPKTVSEKMFHARFSNVQIFYFIWLFEKSPSFRYIFSVFRIILNWLKHQTIPNVSNTTIFEYAIHTDSITLHMFAHNYKLNIRFVDERIDASKYREGILLCVYIF